jgi:hypothetical protein
MCALSGAVRCEVDYADPVTCVVVEEASTAMPSSWWGQAEGRRGKIEVPSPFDDIFVELVRKEPQENG